MTFRDQGDALRAELDALKADLRAATASIEALQNAQRRLERRAGAMEGELPPAEDCCPVCGSASLTRGRLRAQGIRFETDDAGWLEKNFSASTSIDASRCEDCRCTILFDRG